ncbi:TMEM175 family protein [Actinoplanes sp. CA-015351]|uniref:TMEM175 family protein n=1 Tax=Actinoplanes sp. CA-015351 TaxID=3239897 RepID=UPI003D999E8B
MAQGGRYEPERIKMLADAVFAIAMTLLVLELKVPEDVTGGELGRALADNATSYAAYALSFYVLGLVWLGHVRLFRRVEFADDWLLRINLAMLLFVGILPFRRGGTGGSTCHAGPLPRGRLGVRRLGTCRFRGAPVRRLDLVAAGRRAPAGRPGR